MLTSVFILFIFLKTGISEVFILQHTVQIPNCAESYIDFDGLESCISCIQKFTKSFSKRSCFLQTIKYCIWMSPWGCLECSCGRVVNYELTECQLHSIEGCQRLTKNGKGCLQPKLGYTIYYTMIGKDFQYQNMVVDMGTYCGWILEADISKCSICQPGFYLEEERKSCKQLEKKLQNEHAFYYKSNNITEIEFIPGWESWEAKTNAGGFERKIENCELYDDSLERFSNSSICVKCKSGYIPTSPISKCIVGHPLCKLANDVSKLCIKCKDQHAYWLDESTGTCKMRNHMFDNCDVRNLEEDSCIKCSEKGYNLIGKFCERIRNCDLSDGLTLCIHCQDRFYAYGSPQNKCLPILPNCIRMDISQIDPKNHTCQSCHSSYYLFEKLCLIKPMNCKTMDFTSSDVSNHFCKDCNDGYQLFQNSHCFKDIENCVIYLSKNIQGCEVCETMYSPSINKLNCLKHNYQFQLHCQKTDGKGQCLQCTSLRYLPLCENISQYELCLYSDGIANECQQCLPSSYLQDKKCLKADSKCRRTDGKNRCKQCISGYYIDSSYECIKIDNCHISKGVINLCQVCESRSVLTSSGCLRLPLSCAIAEGGIELTCLQCQNGYSLIDSICQQISNCVASNGVDEYCFQCQNFFQLSINKKECNPYNPNPALQPPQFCTIFEELETAMNVIILPSISISITPTFGYCRGCDGSRIPYLQPNSDDINLITKIQQVCVPQNEIPRIIYGCQVYSWVAGKCFRCNNNYHLDMGICIENKTSNCKFSSGGTDPNECAVCQKGFQHNGNACNQNKVSFCKDFDTITQKCKECEIYFKLNTEDNICYFDLNIPCEKGFEYGGVGICLYNPHNQNCLTEFKDECTACKFGYTMIRDQAGLPYCIILERSSDLNCREFSSGQQCLQCTENYILLAPQNNSVYLVCSPKSSNCVLSNASNTRCEACTSGYIDNINFIDACIDVKNCVTPSPGNGKGCTECSKEEGNYLYSPFECKQIPNCISSFDGIKQMCSQCSMNMYPSQAGTCVDLTMEGCILSNGSYNRCEQCNYFYYLDYNDYTCKLGAVDNCQKYEPLSKSSDYICVQCKPSYSLQSSTSCIEIPHCKESDGISALCTSCKDTYYLETATHSCKFPLPFVFYCRRFANDSNTCIECELPYYLSGGKCLPRRNRNDHCLSYQTNMNICSECEINALQGGMQTAPESEFCIPITIDNCTIFEKNQPKCTFCRQKDDYFLEWLTQSRNFCKDVSDKFCLSMDLNGQQCKSCQEGIYFLNPSTMKCQELCLGSSYFDLIEQKCKPYSTSVIKNCDSLDPMKDKCLLCALTYVFIESTNECKKMDVTNCANNGKERKNICLQCSPLHSLTKENTCIPVGIVIQNCSKYISNTSRCGVCNQGYYLNQNNTQCISISAGKVCYSHSHNFDACFQCQDTTYTLSKDGKSCFLGRSTTHCKISLGSTETSPCFLCEKGFIPDSQSNRCIKDIFNIPGCTSVKKIFSNTFYTCSSCQNNYSLINSICLPNQNLSACIINNCEDYQNDSWDKLTCSKCASSPIFELVGNECVFIQSRILIFDAFVMISIIMFI